MSKNLKRHFTIVIKNKENGLYISSTPSLAAKKAVSKLCASNKHKKVEFHIREITRDSKKKTYGPYIGYLEKLTESKYKPNIYKKYSMKGGTNQIFISKTKEYLPYFNITTTENINLKNFRPSNLVFNNKKYFNENNDCYLSNQKQSHTLREESNKKSIFFNFREDITEDILQNFLENNKPKIIKKLKELGILGNVIIDLYVPYISDGNVPNFKKINYIKSGIDDSEITLNDYSNMVEHALSLENIKINLRYLNRALIFIGINECLNFFGKFLSNFNNNLPIISVGSGTAYFEFLINRIFRRDIVCVDPEPTSYTPLRDKNNTKIPNTVFISPKFNYVNNLLSAKKYKDCLLLLNWPAPMVKEQKQYDPYDFNAIIKLKPIGFFVVYETTNCSGSDVFATVLSGSSNSNIVKFKISEEEEISYKLLEDIQKKETPKVKVILEFRNDILDYRIAFYRRTEP